VRGLQSHRDTVERALPGTRTAVNVSGIPKDALRRGMVLTTPGWLQVTTALDVRLRAVRGLAHPIRHNMNVTFHCFADEVNAQIRLLDADELRGGDVAWAQIRLETPVAVVRDDRFVLRTPNDTIGGGTILDVAPTRHRRRDQRVLAALESMRSDDPEERVAATVARRALIRHAPLAAESGLERSRFESALAALVESGAVLTVGSGVEERFATGSYIEGMARRALEEVAAYHRTHRLRPGMPLQELRERLSLDSEVFDILAASWPEILISDGLARLADFAPKPTPDEEAETNAYLAALRSDGESSAAAGKPSPEVFAYLIETGEVVDATGVVFERATFDEVTARIVEHTRAHGSITLGQARDMMGSGRKQAQALLEELDRRKVTRRVGDERVLR
jgi:selenocysteine-specific elongation factor